LIQEYLTAFFLIFIAEMGDKTQILAMAFATQYSMKKVLTGIFLGVLLNHGMAVALGSLLSSIIPINTIQVVAGFAFVGFALWTLKPNKDAGDAEEATSGYGPVFTVAIAFFIGELGDKTQLTTITLAVNATYPLIILAGTISGMLLTGSIGIIVGRKLGDKVPEFMIRLIAASVFLLFGITRLIQTLPSQYVNTFTISLFVAVTGFPSWIWIKIMLDQRKKGLETAFKRRARELHEYYLQINDSVKKICLMDGHCQQCIGNECLINYTKELIQQGMAQENHDIIPVKPSDDEIHDVFDSSKTGRALTLTLSMMVKSSENYKNPQLHRIRRNLETILFNRYLDQFQCWGDYKEWLDNLNDPEADTIASQLQKLISAELPTKKNT